MLASVVIFWLILSVTRNKVSAFTGTLFICLFCASGEPPEDKGFSDYFTEAICRRSVCHS